MKKLFYVFFSAAFIMGVMFLFAPRNVYADELEYTCEKTDASKTIEGTYCTIDCIHYYNRVVISGDSDVAANINTVLENVSEQFMAADSLIFEYAQSDCENEYYDTDNEYYDYAEQAVSYNGSVISIVETQVWYCGGVQNIFKRGYTFSASTGKQITKITSLTNTKKLSAIRKALKKKILASDEYLLKSDVVKVLKANKASDYAFYINKKGNVVVCFQPYELGYGGWYRTFVLKGKLS